MADIVVFNRGSRDHVLHTALIVPGVKEALITMELPGHVRLSIMVDPSAVFADVAATIRELFEQEMPMGINYSITLMVDVP